MQIFALVASATILMLASPMQISILNITDTEPGTSVYRNRDGWILLLVETVFSQRELTFTVHVHVRYTSMLSPVRLSSVCL